MKSRAKSHPPASFRTRARFVTNPASPLCAPRSERIRLKRESSSGSARRTIAVPLIYAVDDLPDLTELYTLVLEPMGCVVRAFNDRAEALAALKEDSNKPALLITDYHGRSMPVARFMDQCLEVHPDLQILMASGFCETGAQFFRTKPDRFIRKPFTPRELCREVRAALVTARRLRCEPPPQPTRKPARRQQ